MNFKSLKVDIASTNTPTGSQNGLIQTKLEGARFTTTCVWYKQCETMHFIWFGVRSTHQDWYLLCWKLLTLQIVNMFYLIIL